MNKKHIVIVGAGPGGLTSAMILAHRGFKVTVFEKADRVGGRNAELNIGNYSFDLGPTFLMMKFILDEMFAEAGADSHDYLDYIKLEPMYKLIFEDIDISPTSDHQKMKEEIRRVYPGAETGLDKLLHNEKIKFEKLFPCLQRDYSSLNSFIYFPLIKAVPHLSLFDTVYTVLGKYFNEEKLKLTFTFQAKYLGMSAWQCPGAFTIIALMEHEFGIYHTKGGLNKISDAMAKVAAMKGAEIHLNTPVKQLIIKNKSVKGVLLEDGREIICDDVIINADFAHAMSSIVEPRELKKWTLENLNKKKYSCSTFMLYLGMDKIYDMPHHSIIFAKDYKKNVDEIFVKKIMSDDISIYIRNSSINDSAIAPQGHSAVYILVPVPNNESKIDWDREKTSFRNKVLDTIVLRTDMKDFKEHIVAEKIITPSDWEKEYSVFRGATFNLAHTYSQMLYFRPRNKFEEFEHCYLVGGGTHPGSGLPTIYESARISSNLICKYYGIPFNPPNQLPNKKI